MPDKTKRNEVGQAWLAQQVKAVSKTSVFETIADEDYSSWIYD
jgi:hypothetical protein